MKTMKHNNTRVTRIVRMVILIVGVNSGLLLWCDGMSSGEEAHEHIHNGQEVIKSVAKAEGAKLYARGNMKGAIRAFEKVLSIDPHDQTTLFRLNEIYDQLFDSFKNDFMPKSIQEINYNVLAVKKIEKLYALCFRKQIYTFYIVFSLLILCGIGGDFLVTHLLKRCMKQ